MKGVDISHYQDGITIRQLMDAGMDFAIIKVTEGTAYTDTSAFGFYREAHELGFPLGGYCYSHAMTPEEAVIEAGHIVETLNGVPMPCGVYLDMEEPEQLALSHDALLEIVRAWCMAIDSAGYTPGIYSSAGTLWAKVSPDETPIGSLAWVAKWSQTPPDLPCDLWQSSDCGTIPGYDGPVDTDEARSDYFKTLVELGRSAHDEQQIAPDACPIGGCGPGDVPVDADTMVKKAIDILSEFLKTEEFRASFAEFFDKIRKG